MKSSILFLFSRYFRNGVKYSGESHFVYRNQLINKTAVLSFLMNSRTTGKQQANIEKSEKNALLSTTGEADEWKTFFDSSQNVTNQGDSMNISLNLNLLMGKNLKDFWRYEGSLTTPPCTENVIWTIFKEEISLFDYEFDMVRHGLYFESYRSPQPVFYRKVYRSFLQETLSSIPDQQCCTISNQSSSTHQTFLLFLLSFLLLLHQFI